MTENVQVAVVGPKLDELVFRAVALIDHFLHHVFVIVQSKADGERQQQRESRQKFVISRWITILFIRSFGTAQ